MTDALTLSRWLSPAFPVGAFAWSHGIEEAVEQGWITNGQSLSAWLTDLLDHGSLKADGVLLAAGWHQTQPLDLLDAEARAFAASAERLEETVEQGTAFCRTLAESGGPDLPPLTYPIALGAAARAEGLDLPLTLTMYLQAVLSNLISAAIRLSVLAQTEGQTVLAALVGPVTATASAVQSGDLDALASATFRSDIAAMAHENRQPRLFRS